jgi:hypothetical protein
VGGGLERERTAAGQEDVGDRHRNGRCDDGGGQMDATTRECERVERDRRRDDGDRAGGMIDREKREHKPAGDDERYCR